jgi:hypothetical protein
MQDGATLHRAKETIWALCGVLGEINGRTELLARIRGPPRDPYVNTCDSYLWGARQQSTWPGGSKTEYSWSSLQHPATWIATSFPRSVVSQQRAHILNILYDGEYNINHYIWLIINEKSKQCVLTAPAARKNFYRQVTQRFRRKPQTVKSMSHQPALWTLCVRVSCAYMWWREGKAPCLLNLRICVYRLAHESEHAILFFLTVFISQKTPTLRLSFSPILCVCLFQFQWFLNILNGMASVLLGMTLCFPFE